MINERRPIQLCAEYRKNIQKTERKKLLKRKRREVIEIDQYWELDNYLSQKTDDSVITLMDSKISVRKEKSRLFGKSNPGEHIEEFCMRMMKSEFKLTKESDYDYHFLTFESNFEIISKHYFYTLLSDFDTIRSVKYLTELSDEKIEILKIFLKGKYTAATVLKFFVKLGRNSTVKRFIFQKDFMKNFGEILKGKNYYLKCLVVDIFSEIAKWKNNTFEISNFLKILDGTDISQFIKMDLYKLTDLRSCYILENLKNSKFLREKVASFQFLIDKLFHLFIVYFKTHAASLLTDSTLFFKTAVEFFNFNHLKRYEVYPGCNLFYKNIDINDFDIANLKPDLLYSLLERAKGNFSYYFLRTVLNHLKKKNKAWNFEWKKFGVALRIKWLSDLEFSVSSLNSYIKSDFNWLISNSHKLEPKVWRMLKRDAERSIYILNYIMEEGMSQMIKFKLFEDVFELQKPSPSKCDKSLMIKTRLKEQQLRRTLANFKKSYPQKTFSLVSNNLQYYSPITQITSERYYLRSYYSFLNFRNRKILKKGEMIQIDENNKVFFTFIENKTLVSITVYRSSDKICIRMEGTHKKRIFSSNYLDGEQVEKLRIDDTLVCKNFILFQFDSYCSLYKVDLNSVKILIKFPRKFLIKEMRFLDNWGYLCLMGPRSICLYDVGYGKIKIIEDFGDMRLLGLEENFRDEIVINMSDRNQYKLKIQRIEIC